MLKNCKELTIYEVEGLRQIFLDELALDTPFILDLKNVEKIDMVGIQLLLSLVATAKAQNKELTLLHIEPHILDEIKRCNCHTFLGLSDG